MHQVTIICTTIARPRCATEFVESLRSYLPDVPAILSEQSEEPALEAICRAQGVCHMALPFDCGISRARNAMLAEVATDFFVLADEDFRFLESPDFAYCIRFLDAHRDFIGITGSLNDLKEVKRTGTEAKNFALDAHGKGLIV